jgi:hypothetical protein
MPFEYILMLFMIIFPPVYWMMNDPRAKSIEDAQNGIYNDDAWNATMPLSENDKRRYKWHMDILLLHSSFLPLLFGCECLFNLNNKII